MQLSVPRQSQLRISLPISKYVHIVEDMNTSESICLNKNGIFYFFV